MHINDTDNRISSKDMEAIAITDFHVLKKIEEMLRMLSRDL